jgi:hypothetical protein
MWNSATAWLPTAFLISFIFPNPVLAEVETSLPALSESDTSESPDASATRAPGPGEMQRQFESQEEFEAAVRAHIEAERAAAWEKAHPPGRRTAAQMMGAPPGSIRVAPSPPNAQEFRERFEDKFDISELRVGIDESASGAPGKFEITGDLVPASFQSEEGAPPLAESVSAAFLMEEAASFGIVDLDDVVLRYTWTGPTGWLYADYHREIGGLRLDTSDIRFEIDPEGHIRRIHGNLPPVPEDLFTAVSRPILTEDEAREVATAEVIAAGRTLFFPVQLTLVLEPMSPYVIWRTENWSPGDRGMIFSSIRIDAATGEVLDYREHERHECH